MVWKNYLEQNQESVLDTYKDGKQRNEITGELI